MFSLKVATKEVICTCTASGFPCHCPSVSYDKLVQYGVIRCRKNINTCDKQKIIDAKQQKQKWINECGGNIEN